MNTNLDFTLIKQLLDDRTKRYNTFDFIGSDPILIPHKFYKKEDIEISALLTATIAWGQRKSIVKNASRLMELMDNSPYDFILETDLYNNENADLKRLKSFVHRTFNGEDCLYFIRSLRNIYLNYNGLESVFTDGYIKEKSVFGALKHFRQIFMEIEHQSHVKKHISDVTANSAAKRLNMFLRWMIRKDDNEVDFGLWSGIPSSVLMLPLDVHTAEVSRALGILTRQQNDWKAVEEITNILKTFDAEDPIKYDFALFGIGVFESKIR